MIIYHHGVWRTRYYNCTGRCQAYIIDEKKASLPGIDDGVNVLEFSLNYNKISKNG